MKKHLRPQGRQIIFALAVLILAAGLTARAQEEKAPVRPEAKKPEKQEGLPLETDRKIEFTTDEGTWLSLDLSPDGRTIIFDLLGDLYTLPAEAGGTARPLVTGLPFDSQPKFSPAGDWIAFVSDRSGSNNLWVVRSDGTEAKQLSREKQAEFISPVWTPDGEYIIVSKSSPASLGAAELWMYHRFGGAGLRITKGRPPAPASGGARPRPGPSFFGAVPTADGKYIYFARQAPRAPGPRFRLRDCQIFRRDLATGEEDQITFAPGNAFRPLVSPDGRTLVYGTRYEGRSGLRLRDLATGEERWLKYPVQRDDQESRPTRDLLPGYVFTPDSREVIVSYEGKIRRVALADGRVREIPFSARVSLDVGPSLFVPKKIDQDDLVRARLIQEPEVSPDGKRLAFSALLRLYTMDLPNGVPRLLTTANDSRGFQPSFSPDGRWIAYVTWSTSGGHIWKTPSDGTGTPQRLTKTAAFYKDPVWSPDGRLIIALRAARPVRVNHPSDFLAPQPGLDIVKLAAAGDGRAEVVAPARGLGKPHFGPEKDRIYVYGNRGLISFRFDGTDPRTHFKVVGKSRGPRPNPAREVRISPDGRRALALVTGQVYFLTVPRGGGDPPTIDVGKSPVPIKKLTDIGADSLAWADGGDTVTWTVGSSFFRQPVSTIVFDPPKKEEPEEPDAEAADEEDTEPKATERRPDEPAANGIGQTKPEKSPAEEIPITVVRRRHTPRGIALLRGARVITMRGGEVIENADLLIRDNRIAAVGERGSLTVPGEARIFDLAGKTIIPGLVDIHAHWEVRHSVLDTEDYTFWGNLAYGVTTGRDPQTNTNDTFAYQDLVETGEMLGPRIFTTGPGIFSNSDFQSYEEAKNTVARYQKYYRTDTLKAYLVGNRRQRQWVARAAKELGIIPTTEGGSNFKLDLTHAIDGFAGNEHALPIVPIYRDVVELFARTRIAYTPTLVVSYGGPQAKYYFFADDDLYQDKKLRRFNPQAVLEEKMARIPRYRMNEHIFPQIAAGADRILRAGGLIGLGGHGELQGLQCHWEMWALHMGGMSNHDALRVGTILSAEAIGYADELGSIEPGKFADLIVLDKNPLEDIKNTNTIRLVMKNGELFEGDTLNQIYPENKPLPDAWWWQVRP